MNRKIVIALAAAAALGLSPGAFARSHHHHHDRKVHPAWVLAPLAAGAIACGLASAASERREPEYRYRQPQAPVPVRPASPLTKEDTYFWCEESQAFYPDVRTCRSGWTAIPANRHPQPPPETARPAPGRPEPASRQPPGN